jgi:uncharacterized cupin superfamily protein
MHQRILNLADVELTDAAPEDRPQGASADLYDLRRGAVASRIGARKLAYRVIAVAPGKRACPFHSHRVEEEMFLILAGSGELRYGTTRHPLRSGDVVACPTGGPDSAHQIINTGEVELRYLAVSNVAEMDICEYPDSGKFLVSAADAASADEGFELIGRAADTADYWDGE